MFKIIGVVAYLSASMGLQADEGWKAIFDGESLEGWMPKFAGYPLGVNFNDTFRVENGVLKASYDQYDRFNGEFGHLFYKLPLSNYRLRMEYRFLGEQTSGAPDWAFRNNGVMLHAQEPGSMTLDQLFPVSIELQFLGQVGEGPRPTGNLCTPGTHVVIDDKLVTQHCVFSSSPTYVDDGWVSIQVEVRENGEITHIVNGSPVLKYQKPQLDPGDPDARRLLDGNSPFLKGGYIALQAESHPTEFRNIEVQCLDEKDCFGTIE